MKKKNRLFIATSLDGYIADKNGGIDWLDTFPDINKIDSGYTDFINNIDALVMGRVTFETVCGFDIEWPYTKPVFVASNSLKEIPKKYQGKVYLVKGTPQEMVYHIHDKGYYQLYIDGGGLIQSFLREDLIDEMIITIIPILLGEGTSLFGELEQTICFECVETKLFLDAIAQNHYKRKRT